MKIAVRYFSRSGNTKKVAEAVAAAAGVRAEECTVPIAGTVDLLFVGGALYAGALDEALCAFLSGLSAETVGRVAVFGTACSSQTALGPVKKALAGSGIPVEERCFHARGRFLLLNCGRPNQKDLEAAGEFARSMVAAAGGSR